MASLDIVSLTIIVLLGLRTGFRGFVTELGAVAALVLGSLGGFLFSALVASWLEPWLGAGPLAQVAGFLLVFLVVFLIVQLLKTSLTAVLDELKLDFMDHFLGFLLGVLEGALLVFVLYLLMSLQTVFPMDSWARGSLTQALLEPFLPWALDLLPGGIPTPLPSIGVPGV